MPDLVAAVAEPNRRRLLQLLGHGEQTVTALTGNFPVSRSAISQHLGVLAEAGLIVSRKEGRFQHYRLRPEGMAALRAELAAFWTSELDQLATDALSIWPAPDRAAVPRGATPRSEGAP
ncbi:MAG: metalloregulator ArsR/SmtB family transcription factor [Actinomycetota bacterium]